MQTAPSPATAHVCFLLQTLCGGNPKRYHLSVAETSAKGAVAAHCQHASEDGGGQCPSTTARIANFCKTFQSTCSDNKYFDTGPFACATVLAKKTVGTFGATGGDSLACREYHLKAAASNPSLHCPHASHYGADVCVDTKTERFDTFCAKYNATCVGGGKKLGSAYDGKCQDVVAKMALGKTGVQSMQDTFSCREVCTCVAGACVRVRSAAVVLTCVAAGVAVHALTAHAYPD